MRGDILDGTEPEGLQPGRPRVPEPRRLRFGESASERAPQLGAKRESTGPAKPRTHQRLTIGYIGNVPEPVGGAEVFLEQLIRHLIDRGARVALARWLRQTIELGPGSQIHYEYRRRETIEADSRGDLTTYYLFHLSQRSELLSLLRIIRHTRKARSFFQRQDVHLIHCHLLIPNVYYGYFAARALRRPFVVTVHGLVDLTAPGHVFRNERIARREREMLIGLLKRSDRVIAVSDEIRTYLTERGVTRVERMSAGVDTEFFRPAEGPERGILFVGNLNDRKGFDVLLEAYLGLSEEIGEPLYLVGKNPNGFTPQNHNVRYLGCLDHRELLPVIQRAKLVVLPSRTEGLPISILEAMACNKMVLVSPVGGLTNLVVEGRNGFLLKELSTECLRATMGRILEDHRTLKERLGEEPRRSVLTYDSRKIAARHLDLYRREIAAYGEKTKRALNAGA